MEPPSLPTKYRRLKHAITTLALLSGLAALPTSTQTVSGETNPQPPMPPLWSVLEDADQDGMTDVDELLWGLDPFNSEDGLSDLDGDDISLAWEFAIGTNPAVADTDMDGWSDSEEYLLYGTDPLDPLNFPSSGAADSGVGTIQESSIPEAEAAEAPPPPSLSNGDFSSVGITTWKSMLTSTEYQGKGFVWNAGVVTSWTAYVGTTVEVWDAGGEKFVELDGSPSSYGIKQPIANPKAGGYVLTWRQSGRNSTRAASDPYSVRVYYMNGTTEVPIAQSSEFSGIDKMQWTDNAIGFQITPAQITAAGTNPIYVAFIPSASSLNTYGTLIDKVNLMPVAVVELSPKVQDEDGNDIAGSDKPTSGKPLTPFVEVDPYANRIAHRELKVLIGSALQDKKVTWTLEPLPGARPANIRGDWDKSPNHKDRFEASTAYGANGFKRISQSSGETTVGSDGHTAIRVNVPPIGFNQVRINIQIEGIYTSINLIDMEVPGVIVIDPGHGGKDSGTVGAGDVKEKELALAYSLSLRQELINKFTHEKQGLKIVMTRKTTEAFPSLASRPQRARDTGADIFVSIHFNSGAATARGTETFVERTSDEASAGNPGDNKNVDEDITLATAINTTTVNAVTASDAGALNRGVKREGKAVTRDGASYNGNTQDYHPVKACLLEVEFLSHPTALESIKLSNASGVAIKDAFAENAANDIFTHLQNQQ